MNYMNLNDATRKGHYPVPFIDQMLDRLAGQEYYCFLDGYSGYNQIVIELEDYIHLSIWHLCVQTYVIRIMQCTNDIPEMLDGNLP